MKDEEMKVFADQLSHVCNRFMSTNDLKDFAELICKGHRTLQQNKMRIFLKCIEKWAKDYELNMFDLRNAKTCELSFKIVEAFGDDFHLPSV